MTRRRARRQAELRELARLMRERGALAALPPPTPLHRMGQQRAKQATTTTTGDRP